MDNKMFKAVAVRNTCSRGQYAVAVLLHCTQVTANHPLSTVSQAFYIVQIIIILISFRGSITSHKKIVASNG